MARGRVNSYSKDFKRKRESTDTFGPFSDWLRGGACLLAYEWDKQSRCWGDVVPAHLDPRGMGGGRGDWVDCRPCEGHGHTLELPAAHAVGDGPDLVACGYCRGWGIAPNVTRLCQGHHLEWDNGHERFIKRHGVNPYILALEDAMDFLTGPRNVARVPRFVIE